MWVNSDTQKPGKIRVVVVILASVGAFSPPGMRCRIVLGQFPVQQGDLALEAFLVGLQSNDSFHQFVNPVLQGLTFRMWRIRGLAVFSFLVNAHASTAILAVGVMILLKIGAVGLSPREQRRWERIVAPRALVFVCLRV
jgi:hypothetical protein